MAKQLWFDFSPKDGAFRQQSFCNGRSNAHARRAFNRWRTWQNGALILIGPKGCGKSHLSFQWHQTYGGQVCAGRGIPPGLAGPCTIEDVDQDVDEEALFHLLNRAINGEVSVLMTARTAPRSWPLCLGDLQSRILASEQVQISEPDDDVLKCILQKLLMDRSLKVDERVLSYLVGNMERSSQAALLMVDALNARSLENSRSIKIPLVREILEEQKQEPELLSLMRTGYESDRSDA